MSDKPLTIEVQVQKRLRLDTLLPLDEHEQRSALQEHHESLLQLTHEFHDHEEELAEKKRALLYEFAARLCELELSLLQLMQPDRPPLREQKSVTPHTS